MKKFKTFVYLFILLFSFPLYCPAQESLVRQKVVVLAEKINKSFAERFGTAGKSRLAVTLFSEVGETAKEKKVGTIVSEILSNELSKSDLFTMVERMRLEKVLEEQKLALSGILNSEKSAEVGNLLGAQAIISGTVVESGDNFIVNARMVDVEKGSVMLAESVEIPINNLIALSSKYIVTKKYPLSAGFRSLLIPGWGQFYNDTPTRGYIYLGSVAAAIGAALYFNTEGDDNYKTYQENTMDSVPYYDKAVDSYQKRDYALYAAAGIWIINVLDALITASKQTLPERKTLGTGKKIKLKQTNEGFLVYMEFSF